MHQNQACLLTVQEGRISGRTDVQAGQTPCPKIQRSKLPRRRKQIPEVLLMIIIYMIKKPCTNDYSSKVPCFRLISSRNTCRSDELINEGIYDRRGYRFGKLNEEYDQQLAPGQGSRFNFVRSLVLSVRAILVKIWGSHLGCAGDSWEQERLTVLCWGSTG